jgi:hypothetical protein
MYKLWGLLIIFPVTNCDFKLVGSLYTMNIHVFFKRRKTKIIIIKVKYYLMALVFKGKLSQKSIQSEVYNSMLPVSTFYLEHQ